MPSSIRYPVEAFVPQANGSGTTAPQQQQTPIRNRPLAPTPRPPVEMPATNGSGRVFSSIFQRNRPGTPAPQQREDMQTGGGPRTPTPRQQQEVQTQRSGSVTPVPRQQEELRTPRNVPRTDTPRPQQIPMQNGNGSQSAHASREPPCNYPLLMNIESQTYIRFEEAARFFAQQSNNAAPLPPHPHQPNGHHRNWAPHSNGHNDPFPPQPNGHGDQDSVSGELIFRPQTAPPPPMLPPEGLPGRSRSDTIRSEYAFPFPLPYYQLGNNQYCLDDYYPTDQYYQPNGQVPYLVKQFALTVPPVSWCAPAYLRKTAPKKLDDPEAKLFVGDLPIRMTTEALGDALEKRFSPFGDCKVNVTWRLKGGTDGTVRSLPTGWIQYKNVFEAAKALDVAKEQGFAIGNRPMRIDRADGKRICRMWPSNPHATPGLDDFKNAIRQYVHHTSLDSAYLMLCHVSDKVEMVDKNYGGRIFTVPSVGIVFRWVEDANYSEQKFSEFTHKFRLKIEHVNSGMPRWREGPVSVRVLDALMLDTGEKWQEELTLSRRRLQSNGENFPGGKMANYPDRISKKLIPRSILEHPRLKKDILDFDPVDNLEWLNLHREPPTALARAINTKKMRQINGHTNGHCKAEVNHETNSQAEDSINGETDQYTKDA
ncbi:hypothetical protein EYB26_008995 [Talaromyces marneffei]|uniref:uncharacterized protein n=1 Tax=Talaromyces marneffei TaxID=37727 RepID=UPI0012A944EB|nr:uncharacterized protein EYB26_008995 [Talaromyces marneffei]QGA21285.1 hypothetical protein EYB26_008995 [Talaromyces marneffei]